MTDTIRKFLRRPGADRRLLAHALLLYLAIAALLRVVSHGRLTRWLDAVYPATSHQPPATDQIEVERVAWAVRTVAARVRIGPSCLTAALTAQYLLRRAGHAAALRIGVARSGSPGDVVARSSAPAPIAAHAWIEHAGRIVVGGDAAPAYQVLQAPSPMRGER